MALASARAFGQIVMATVFVLVARDLGPLQFGLFVTSFSMAMVAAGAIDFGASNFLVREHSAGRITETEVAGRAAGKIVTGLVVATLTALAGLAGLLPQVLVPASVLVTASVIAQTHQMLLLAAGRTMVLSLAATLERALLGAVFFAGVTYFSLGAVNAFLLGYLVGSFLTACLVWTLAAPFRPKLGTTPWSATWSGTTYYGIYTLIVSAQALDVVVAAVVSSQDVVGSYGAVARWTAPILLVTSSFATLLNPVVSGAQNKRDVWRRIKTTLWLPAVSLGIAALVFVLADPLVDTALGNDYSGSAAALRWLAVAAALSTCAQVASTVLQARRRERSVAIYVGASVATQLLSVALLAGPLGASGVAMAAVVGQGILLVCVAVHAALIVGRRG